jgi:hypothetical protein
MRFPSVDFLHTLSLPTMGIPLFLYFCSQYSLPSEIYIPTFDLLYYLEFFLVLWNCLGVEPLLHAAFAIGRRFLHRKYFAHSRNASTAGIYIEEAEGE